MRYKKQAIVIASLIAVVVFMQCSKTFEKTDTDPLSGDEKSMSSEKTKSLIAQGREIFRFDRRLLHRADFDSFLAELYCDFR